MRRITRLNFEIANNAGQDIVCLSGALNEDALPILTSINVHISSRHVVFVLEDLAWINMSGARAWIWFLRDFRNGRDVALDRCGPCFVQQMNIMPAVAESCEIRSVLYPMRCEGCEMETLQPMVASEFALAARAPSSITTTCKVCGDVLKGNSSPAEFFEFACRPRLP